MSAIVDVCGSWVKGLNYPRVDIGRIFFVGEVAKNGMKCLPLKGSDELSTVPVNNLLNNFY